MLISATTWIGARCSRMHRFYFHLHERGTCLVDEEGQALPCFEVAFQEAVCAARTIMADEVKSGRFCLDGRIEITNG